MAELPERQADRSPARQAGRSLERTLFDRTPAFGLAREAERLPVELPPPDVPAEPRRPRRERGPFVTYLSLPWSYGDSDTGDRWRRLQCRWGRHRMAGGNTMQVGGEVVFVERRCRWCDAAG